MSIYTAITKAYAAIMYALMTHGYLQEEFTTILRQSITERLKSPNQRIISTILFLSSFITAAHRLHLLLGDVFETTSCMDMNHNGIIIWLELQLLLVNTRRLRALLSSKLDFIRLCHGHKLMCRPWSCIACEQTATSFLSDEERVQVLNRLDSDIQRFWEDLDAIFCFSTECGYCTKMFETLAIVKCQDVTPCEGYGRKVPVRVSYILARQWQGHLPFVINAFANSRTTSSHRGSSSRISRALGPKYNRTSVSGDQISWKHRTCTRSTCYARGLRSRSDDNHSGSVELDICECPTTSKPYMRGFARALKVWSK